MKGFLNIMDPLVVGTLKEDHCIIPLLPIGQKESFWFVSHRAGLPQKYKVQHLLFVRVTLAQGASTPR